MNKQKNINYVSYYTNLFTLNYLTYLTNKIIFIFFHFLVRNNFFFSLIDGLVKYQFVYILQISLVYLSKN